jgi:hypothetical protein
MATLLGLLPTILTLLGYALKWYGASEETLKQYNNLVEQSAKDNLISVNMKDRILGQRQSIRDRVKAKEEAEANKPK